MNNLEIAILRLEQLKPDFSYDDAPVYAQLVRDFYSGMKFHLQSEGLPLESPLVDSVSHLMLELPHSVEDRLAAVISRCDDYGTTINNVARWYLREAYAMQLGLIDREVSLYEPLIHILEMGGHFYQHHGALVLSDAATIPFIRR